MPELKQSTDRDTADSALLRLRAALDDMLKRVSKRPNAAEIWPKINLTLADWRAIHRSLFGE